MELFLFFVNNCQYQTYHKEQNEFNIDKSESESRRNSNPRKR